MRLAIDVMGGDHAPNEIVKGVLLGRDNYKKAEFILFGDEQKIKKLLIGKSNERLEICHTSEVITNEDDPVRAFRNKKDASMVRALQMVKENRADACISAGNTGAYLTASLFMIGRIEGILRPALAPFIPTMDRKGTLLLDAGASSEAKPEYLLQYALMAEAFVENVNNIKKPRVGLLNIGTEENKGSPLTKEAFKLLRTSNLNFIGNVEAKECLSGVADILVTDGFTGNMILKTTEGTAKTIMREIKKIMTSNLSSKVASLFLKGKLQTFGKVMDDKEYGGAPLLGVRAPIIKAHGSSEAFAFSNAIRQAVMMVSGNITQKISDALQINFLKKEDLHE